MRGPSSRNTTHGVASTRLDLRQRSSGDTALGEELPRLWRAATTRSTDRKQIVRLVIKDVALIRSGDVVTSGSRSARQTGAASEHWLQRCVATSNTPIRTVSGTVSPSLTGSRRWMARSQRFSTRRRFRTAHAERRSPAAWFMFCGRGGGSERQDQWYSRELSSGPMEATRSRARGHRITPSVIFDWLRKGWLDRHATRQGYALANLTIPRPSRSA